MRAGWLEALAAQPAGLREAVAGLSEVQLQTPYREGGWTVRQVVHHIPDSHMHAYIRFKQALTEPEPLIKPYHEAPTALLADYTLPLEPSLAILEHVHLRWVTIARALNPPDFARVFVHPATGRWTLDEHLALYVWHGDHHTAHITALRKGMGW
jgi:uncharacterized damage-inducible protein DinB